MKHLKLITLFAFLLILNSCKKEFEEFVPCTTLNEDKSFTLLEEELYVFGDVISDYDPDDYFAPIIIGDELIYQHRLGFQDIQLIKKNITTGEILQTLNTRGILTSNAKRYGDNLLFIENQYPKRMMRINLENFEVTEFDELISNFYNFSTSSDNYFLKKVGYLDGNNNEFVAFEVYSIETFEKVNEFNATNTIDANKEIESFDYLRDEASQTDYLILSLSGPSGTGSIDIYNIGTSELVHSVENHLHKVFNSLVIEDRLFLYIERLEKTKLTEVYNTPVYEVLGIDIPNGTTIWEQTLERKLSSNILDVRYNESNNHVVFYDDLPQSAHSSYDYFQYDINNGITDHLVRPVLYADSYHWDFYKSDIIYTSSNLIRYNFEVDCVVSESEYGNYKSFLIHENKLYAYYYKGFRIFQING